MENIFKICSYLVVAGIKDNKPISNISLQKILYFSQGIHLAEKGDPLFKNKIYAWEYGPVVKEVYHRFKYFGNNHIVDKEKIRNILGKDFLLKRLYLSEEKVEFMGRMWNLFKKYDPFELVKMTHVKDSPWYNIYEQHNGEPPRNLVIPIEEMKLYFKDFV